MRESIKIISWNVRALNCPNKTVEVSNGCFTISFVILLFFKSLK